MKLRRSIIQFALILLSAALVVISANAQESRRVKSEARQPPEDYALATATAQHPLKPPETSSPRETLANSQHQYRVCGG